MLLKEAECLPKAGEINFYSPNSDNWYESCQFQLESLDTDIYLYFCNKLKYREYVFRQKQCRKGTVKCTLYSVCILVPISHRVSLTFFLSRHVSSASTSEEHMEREFFSFLSFCFFLHMYSITLV